MTLVKSGVVMDIYNSVNLSGDVRKVLTQHGMTDVDTHLSIIEDGERFEVCLVQPRNYDDMYYTVKVGKRISERFIKSIADMMSNGICMERAFYNALKMG